MTSLLYSQGSTRTPPGAFRVVGYAAILLVSLLTACDDNLPQASHRLGKLLEAPRSSNVRLRAALVRDTILASDGAPVHVVFALVGGTQPAYVEIDSRRFGVRVIGPDGKTARSLGGSGPPLASRPEQFLSLAPGAALVERRDLRCVREHELIPSPASQGDDDCLARYALADTGPYRIIVEYYAPESHRVGSDSDSGRREESTPRRSTNQGADWPPHHVVGVVLADTVLLTVVRR